MSLKKIHTTEIGRTTQNNTWDLKDIFHDLEYEIIQDMKIDPRGNIWLVSNHSRFGVTSFHSNLTLRDTKKYSHPNPWCIDITKEKVRVGGADIFTEWNKQGAKHSTRRLKDMDSLVSTDDDYMYALMSSCNPRKHLFEIGAQNYDPQILDVNIAEIAPGITHGEVIGLAYSNRISNGIKISTYNTGMLDTEHDIRLSHNHIGSFAQGKSRKLYLTRHSKGEKPSIVVLNAKLKPEGEIQLPGCFFIHKIAFAKTGDLAVLGSFQKDGYLKGYTGLSLRKYVLKSEN